LIAILFPSKPTLGAECSAGTTLKNVRIDAVASDQTSVDVICPSPSGDARDHLVVTDTALKNRVKQLEKGDLITATLEPKDGQKALKAFSLDTTSPSATTRVWVLLGAALISFLLYWLLSGLHPLRLIIGEDNRYSNSKFQIALWFFVVITTYMATMWLRGIGFFGGVNIPKNLLLLSGMSALTFGGAKAITAGKVEDARAKGIADPKQSANAKPNFFMDLTHNDGPTPTAPPAAAPVLGAAPAAAQAPANAAAQRRLDLGDFQMVVITLLAVVTYLVLVFNFLGTIEKTMTVSLPDIDTTILATFGLGHGAYLAKKAAGNVSES